MTTNTTATSSARMPRDAKNLADLYKLDPIPWSRALEALESNEPQKQTPFLTTTRPDGRPHVAGVGALWDNGKVYVVSGPGTRKSRNLAKNPSCIIAFSLTGIDLVIEGTRPTSDRRRDPAAHGEALRRPGWPATVKDGAFTHEYSAPSAGPPPWYVYEITPTTVYGVLERRAGRRHSLAVLTTRPPGAVEPGAPVAATTARVRRSVSMASA